MVIYRRLFPSMIDERVMVTYIGTKRYTNVNNTR